MNKLSIKVDLGKIDKNRFELRSYVNKEGQTVTVKEMSMEVIPMKEPKIIASGDTWELVKVGIVTQKQTKEEQVKKTLMPIIGSAAQFKDKVEVPSFDRDSQGQPITVTHNSVEDEDIPF